MQCEFKFFVHKDNEPIEYSGKKNILKYGRYFENEQNMEEDQKSAFVWKSIWTYLVTLLIIKFWKF